MEKLVPVDTANAVETKPQVDSKPAGTESNQQPQETPDKGYDSQEFMNNSMVAGSAQDQMREFTHEQEDAPWSPLSDGDSEQEATPQPPPNPEQPAPRTEEKPAEQPAADNMIELSGRKFKDWDKVGEAYQNLHKDYHKKNFEHKQSKRRDEAMIKKLDGQRKFLEQSLQKSIVDKVYDSPQAAKPKFTKEQFEDMLAEDNGYEAVMSLIEQQSKAAIPAKPVGPMTPSYDDVIDNANAKIDADYQKQLINDTVQSVTDDPDCTTFAQNKHKFGDWCSERFGGDETGQKLVDNICSDPTRLKSMYQTYLKDTVDFTDVIQKAKGDGQAMAVRKEQLTPMPSAPVADAGGTGLVPVVDELDSMERSMGVGTNSGSRFGKNGFFR